MLLLEKFSLLALHLLPGTRFPLLWGPPFSLHAPALIPLFLAKVRLSLTLTLSYPGDWVRYGIMAQLNFKEKYGTKLRMKFSGILSYGTEIRFCFFYIVPYSFRRPNLNLKSSKDFLC